MHRNSTDLFQSFCRQPTYDIGHKIIRKLRVVTDGGIWTQNAPRTIRNGFINVNHVVQRHWHDGRILTAEDFVISNDLETNDVLWFFIAGHVQSMKS